MTRKSFRVTLIAALFAFAATGIVGAQSNGQGQGAAKNNGQRITPSFKDAEIGQVIEAVAAATGKTIIPDPRVRAQYGLAGALAAEGYRRMRDVYQVLDLSPEQKDSVVDVVEMALIAGGALGAVDEAEVERIDVDPGAPIDRARFERAIAESTAITRCLRPGRGDRFYQLELSRRGGSGRNRGCG